MTLARILRAPGFKWQANSCVYDSVIQALACVAKYMGGVKAMKKALASELQMMSIERDGQVILHPLQVALDVLEESEKIQEEQLALSSDEGLCIQIQ